MDLLHLALIKGGAPNLSLSLIAQRIESGIPWMLPATYETPRYSIDCIISFGHIHTISNKYKYILWTFYRVLGYE